MAVLDTVDQEFRIVLTHRQIDIFTLSRLAAGHSDREIACELELAEGMLKL